MQKRFLTATLAIFLSLLTLSSSALAAFIDVPKSHPNYVSIDYLQKNNIVKGNPDGTFAPERVVNRAEALKMIFEAAGIVPDQTSKESTFPDVKSGDWFHKYVELARRLEIVKGNPDGTFAPARSVNRAEMLKMMLETYRFNQKDWAAQTMFSDVNKDNWFAAYVNYAGHIGLVQKDENGKVFPEQNLTRGQVAEIIYLMTVIRRGNDNQFLLNQAEMHITQIEAYVAAKNIPMAKRSSELAVDMTQQALKSLPDNKVVLGAAKIARAYDFVLQSYIAGLQKNNEEAIRLANDAINKATEAWEANNDTQPIAKHIKDRAREIIQQIEAAG